MELLMFEEKLARIVRGVTGPLPPCEFDQHSQAMLMKLVQIEIPQHMVFPLFAYVLEGAPIGGFLTSVLCNDFHELAGRADHLNQQCLLEWAKVLHMIPSASWGNAEAVQQWQERGGLYGVLKERNSSVANQQ